MYAEKDMLVRAKDKDTGEWMYGYYYHYEDTVFCFEEDYAKLSAAGEDPRHDAILFDRQGDWGLPNRHMKAEPLVMETLSRRSPFYIEKNRMRSSLYEGDIVSTADLSQTYTGVLRYGKYAGVSEAEPYHFGWYIEWLDDAVLRPEAGYWITHDSLHLKGNIWDNPELFMQAKEVQQ